MKPGASSEREMFTEARKRPEPLERVRTSAGKDTRRARDGEESSDVKAAPPGSLVLCAEAARKIPHACDLGQNLVLL
jgi:hypothetical protein